MLAHPVACQDEFEEHGTNGINIHSFVLYKLKKGISSWQEHKNSNDNMIEIAAAVSL